METAVSDADDIPPGTEDYAYFQTYFVTTPGSVTGSYIHYPDNDKLVYYKFGDIFSDKEESRVGLRHAYLTHNPEMGIWVIMRWATTERYGDNDVYLGTAIKRHLIDALHIPRVRGDQGDLEWFKASSAGAYRLVGLMRQSKWHDNWIDQQMYRDLLNDINLTNPR